MTFIHPTAVIDSRADIGSNCYIGPYCVVGADVVIGEGCILHSHVVLDGYTEIGKQNAFFPFTSIGLKTQDLKWSGGVTRTRIGESNTFRECVTVHSATGDGEVTEVGSNNNILAYSHIAHNVKLHDHVIMSNAATLAGHIEVEDFAVIGGLAAIHQFCRIGKMSIIGGCSKVVQDVLPYMLVDGNPASTRTVNKVGMERHGIPDESQIALKQVYKILFRERLTLGNAMERVESEFPDIQEVRHIIQFLKASRRGISR